jgi:hypothetical protein
MQIFNVVYQENSSFNKYIIKNIEILHECKESRDVDKMMKQSENECQDKKNI